MRNRDRIIRGRFLLSLKEILVILIEKFIASSAISREISLLEEH